jgi:hypothetical protein
MTRFRPFWLVLLLAAYLPLEEFILKWLPVSDTVFLMLRQIPDVLLIAITYLVLCDRLMRFRGLHGFGRGFDWLLALFLASATITMFLNPGASIVPFAAHLKALFRYILLAYIVRSYPVYDEDRKRLVRVLLAGVWIQIFLGLVQLGVGIPARNFLAGRDTSSTLAGFATDFTGTRFAGANNLMGTMGNTIDYGTFLVVGLALFLCMVPQERRLRRWAGVFLSVFCIYMTNSRSALIASLIVILSYVYLRFGRRQALLYAAGFAGCIAVGAALIAGGQSVTSSPNGDYQSRTRFFDILSSDYIQGAMNQRLGLAVYLAPDFLSDLSAAPFGFSPDPQVVVNVARNRFPDVPDSLVLVLSGIIEDVYWLALMIDFGVIGMLLFLAAVLWAIRTLAMRFRLEDRPDSRSFILFALLLMIACIPLNCFNQVLLFRQFPLCLWISFALALTLPRKDFRAYSPDPQ